MKPDWQKNVRDRLPKVGLNVKELAKKIGAAQSTVQDLLNSPEARYSSLVPAVHEAIGWDPPPDPGESPPLPSPDAIELGHMYDRLPEAIRKSIRDQAAATLATLDLMTRQATKGDGN